MTRTLRLTLRIGTLAVLLSEEPIASDTDAADTMAMVLCGMANARGYARDLMPVWPDRADAQVCDTYSDVYTDVACPVTLRSKTGGAA